MYPKNAASPERIAVGQVVLIADGTVQTSGVSITHRGQGAAEAAGGGTTAYGADGTVYYTPTQAETNYSSFVIIAYKSSCFSASQTIITTASATAGKVVLSGETHTSAVIPTVSTLTGHTPQTGDTYALANGASGFVAIKGDTAAILVDTGTTLDAAIAAIDANVDAILLDTAEIGVAGAGLTEAGGTGDQFTGIASVGAVSGAVGSVTGNVGGNVVGSVASVTAGVTVSTNNDKTGYALSSAGVDAIFDEPTAGHVTAGTYGVAITDVLADTADIQPKLGTPAADISADIAAVKVDTAAILVDTGTSGVLVATGGIGSGALTSAAENSIADAMLDRNMATGTDSGTNSTAVRTPRQALRALRNKVSISGGTATVTKEDDSTTSWTSAISTTAGDPISTSDPS